MLLECLPPVTNRWSLAVLILLINLIVCVCVCVCVSCSCVCVRELSYSLTVINLDILLSLHSSSVNLLPLLKWCEVHRSTYIEVHASATHHFGSAIPVFSVAGHTPVWPGVAICIQVWSWGRFHKGEPLFTTAEASDEGWRHTVYDIIPKL